MRNGPDALTGAVLAIEGISDAGVVMHGSTGCRKNMVCFSRRYFTRIPSEPKDAFDSFISQSDRVPYSDVSSSDLISGGCGKLSMAISEQRPDETLFVLGTPGTAVNGDSIESAVKSSGRGNKIHILDFPEMSAPMCKGFDHAITQAVSFLAKKERNSVKDTVNILGLNIWTKSWEAVSEELENMLSSVGISVICKPGMGSSCEDIANSIDAEYNLVMAPEYCAELTKFYEKYGIESVNVGIPVGYEATRERILKVAALFGKDASETVEKINKKEIATAADLEAARFSYTLRGGSFCIYGDASLVIPMTEWLYSYLSLVPDSVMFAYGSTADQKEHMMRFLSSVGSSDAFMKEPSDCEFYFSDGVDSKHMQISGICRKGVSIANPQPIKEFRPAQVIGCGGVLYLLDCLINF